MRKRTVTTIEIHERLLVSPARNDVMRLPCPVCAERAMVTPEAAAALARVTVRSIYARIEAGSVHFLERPDGLLLLCADSLSLRAQSEGLKKLVGATDTGAPPQSKEHLK